MDLPSPGHWLASVRGWYPRGGRIVITKFRRWRRFHRFYRALTVDAVKHREPLDHVARARLKEQAWAAAWAAGRHERPPGNKGQ